MAVAYFRAWAPRGFFPIANGGEEATLNTFLFLWLAAAGAGALSVDGWLEKRYRWSPWHQLTRWEPYVRAVLRFIVGFLLVLHGVRTIFGILPSVAGRRNAVTLALDALPHVAGYVEVVGGVLLGLGIFVQPASVILCAQAIVAYVAIAMPRGPWPIRNGGNEALIYVAVLLYLAVAEPPRGILTVGRRSRRR
jgi:putative oxidoreductase